MNISGENVTIMELDEYSDSSDVWEDTNRLSHILHMHLERLDCTALVTFDEYGVSGHPNHIGCHAASIHLHRAHNVRVFVLESICIWRKYISVLDLPIALAFSFLNGSNVIVSRPSIAYTAMREHRTQLVWFRLLYMLFSSYTMINSLRRLDSRRVKAE